MTVDRKEPDVTSNDKDTAANSLRLKLPEPQFDPANLGNGGDSSPEVSQDGLSPTEDIQDAVGFSISRTQTRMASHQTPSAEKAAVMGGLDGMFEDMVDEEESSGDPVGTHQAMSSNKGPQTPSASPLAEPELPSPWRARPKTFERLQSKGEAVGTSSIFPDVGFKLPSFPSLNKVSSIRESLPSLGSILGTVRAQSPGRKGSVRKKRASTVVDQKQDWVLARNEARPAKSRIDSDENVQGSFQEGSPRTTQPKPSDDARRTQPIHSPAQAAIHRSTSDQSLYLRRVKSTTASLGDDTRWETVSEQVNSRAKAFMDSFQDSSLKRYTLSNLPNFSFRPDFLRARSQSEGKPRSEAGVAVQENDQPSMSRPLPGIKPLSGVEQALPTQHPHLDQALAKLTGDLVLLGGYRGSILRSAKPPNRRLWIPVKVGLNIRKVNLEVGLEPEDEEKMEESIIPDGILSHIGPIDMGRRLLRKIRSCKNVREGKLRLHEYGYDWRLSPHLLSRKLVNFLESLPCNQPGVSTQERGATVISHSMGGLITRHAVNTKPTLFASVVYVSVPQHCINILGPFRNGDQVLLSSNVLTAQTNFSMRSSFLLLPDDGHGFINKHTGEKYPVDFFSTDNWEKYAWSPCVAPADPAPSQPKSLLSSLSDSLPSLPFSGRKPTDPSLTADTAVTKISPMTPAVDPELHSTARSAPIIPITIPLSLARAYLQRTLAEVLRFRHELAFHPPHHSSNIYPPLALIYANNTPTVLAAKVDSCEAIRRADAYDDLKFGSGDGVVLAKAAMLPEGYKAVKGGKVKSERGHVGLLGDLEAVGKALWAVMRGRDEGVGLDSVKEGSAAKDNWELKPESYLE